MALRTRKKRRGNMRKDPYNPYKEMDIVGRGRVAFRLNGLELERPISEKIMKRTRVERKRKER
jgi:hypothetical protein